MLDCTRKMKQYAWVFVRLFWISGVQRLGDGKLKSKVRVLV